MILGAGVGRGGRGAVDEGSGGGGVTLTFVRGADLVVGVLGPLLLVVLRDGLGGGVVDVELLGDLSHKIESYIDDAPPILNALDQFRARLLPHLLVFLRRESVLHVDRLQLVPHHRHFRQGRLAASYFPHLRSHFI